MLLNNRGTIFPDREAIYPAQDPMLFSDKIKIRDLNTDKIYEIMKRDKKNKDEIIKFVLLSGSGKIMIDVEAKKQDVLYALENGTGYFTA